MFRLGADAAASSARFERLNEFFIYIPNDEIGHSSSNGTMNDSNDITRRLCRQAFVSLNNLSGSQVSHGVNRQNRIYVFGSGLTEPCFCGVATAEGVGTLLTNWTNGIG